MDAGLVSKYRTELMGAAMVAVVLFHVPLARSSQFFGLHRMGNIGVDIFLFLSGMGLWFAWGKSPGLWKFYRRRLARIYPAWIAVAAAYYLLLHKQDAPSTIGDILVNLSFWTRGSLTFWFVPAIIALYIAAPAYLELIRRWPAARWLPVCAMCWCVAVHWVAPVHAAAGYLEIFWSRIPIFLIGVNFGSAAAAGTDYGRAGTAVAAFVFAAALALGVYMEQHLYTRFPLFVMRMVYIPMSVSAVLLAARLFSTLPQRLLSPLRALGLVSLEMYLLHVEFLMRPLLGLKLGYWPLAAATIAVGFAMAWLLHKGAGYVAGKIA